MFEERGTPGAAESKSPTRRELNRPRRQLSATRNINPATLPARGQVALEFSEEKTFREYLLVVYRYRILIVILALVGFSLAWFYNKRAERLYASSALVNIGSYIPITEDAVSKNLSEDSSKEEYLETQIALLQSYKIAERVLRNNQEIRDFLMKPAPGSVPSAEQGIIGDITSALKAYLGLIEISEVKSTKLVRITATTGSAQMSAKIANRHADEFINLVLEDRKRLALVNLDFINKRLDEAKARLKSAKDKKLAFARQNPSIAANMESFQKSFQAKYDALLSNMNDAMNNYTVKGAEARALGRQSPEDIAVGVGEIDKYMNVEKLRSEYDAWRKVIKNEQHPYLADYRRQIRLAEEAMEKYARQRRESADLAYRLSRDRQELLRREFDKLTSQEREHSEVKVEYDAFLLEEAIAKEELDKLSEKLNDSLLNAENEQKNITMIDPAVPDFAPVKPRVMANLLKGTLLGLMLGLILSFLLEVSDSSIRTIQDLERMTDLHVLGIIPRFPGRLGRRSSDAGSGEEQAGETPTDENAGAKSKRRPLVVALPQSRESEAIRSILVSISSSPTGDDPRIILVTSSEKGEGKTSLAVNLAAALAEVGEQTLLIDADLRLPSVHTYFEVPKGNAGLAECVGGQSTIYDAVRETGIANLSGMFSGSEPESPTFFLRSPRLPEILAELSSLFDYIIIDSPPVGAVSDALLLARHVHGVALVVRCKTTPRYLVTSTIDRLKRVGAPLLGIVLNDVEKSSGRATYGYYSERYYRRPAAKESKNVKKAWFAAGSKPLQENRSLGTVVRAIGSLILLAIVFGSGFFFSRMSSTSGTAADKGNVDKSSLAHDLQESAPQAESTVEPSRDPEDSAIASEPPAETAAAPAASPGLPSTAAAPEASFRLPGEDKAIAPALAPVIQEQAAPGSAAPESVSAAPAASPPAAAEAAIAPPAAAETDPQRPDGEGQALESQPTNTPAPASAVQNQGRGETAETTTHVPSGWYVQLGYSRKEEAAQSYCQDLAKTGHSCQSQTVIRGSSKFYRVLVGPARTRDDAAALLSRLQGRITSGGSYPIREFH